MAEFTLFYCFLIFGLGASSVEGLTGNVCTRQVETFVTERICAYNSWAGCCVWKYIRVCKFVSQQYCCDGWKDDGKGNCNVAICSEGCFNGVCKTPNNCECAPGYSGSTCGSIICSHLKPCYPGVCTTTLPDQCTCNDGFSGTNCLTIKAEPEYVMARVEIANFNDMKNMDIYNLTTDATDPGAINHDYLWTNMEKFTEINIEFQGTFSVGNVPVPPSYITASKFGVVGAYVTYDTKKKNGDLKGSVKTAPCNSALSNTKPETGVLTCSIKDKEYLYRVDNGDVFTVNFFLTGGGYEDLSVNGKLYKAQTFGTKLRKKYVEFRFDKEVPQHCSELNNCDNSAGTRYPVKIVDDITKKPIEVVWSGWTDADSGMGRYALEFFKLAKKGDLLLEVEPLNPVFITDFNESAAGTKYSHTYTPNDIGMYSVILEAADSANNSRYLRRFVLYDPSSNITFETGSSKKFRVSSASLQSQYTWQANTDKVATEISVDWTDHFTNKWHVDGGFLNEIFPYPAQLLDPAVSEIHKKKIDTVIVDNTVSRTSSKINNFNAITSFEIVTASKIFGQAPDTPTSNWRKISPLAQVDKFSHTANAGDCLMIWVRAYDIVGNNATDSTLVCFDSSKPIIRSASVTEKNAKGTIYNAASRISLSALDLESGISRVEWNTFDNTTDKAIKSGYSLIINATTKTKAECDQVGDCYCITSGECISIDHTFDLDHCALYQQNEDLTKTVVRLEITVYNKAVLTQQISFTISGINTFDGMDHCESIITVIVPAAQTATLTSGGIAGISIALLLALAFVLFVIFLWRTGRLQKIKEQSTEKIYGMRTSIRKANVGAVGYKQYQTGGFDQDDIYFYGTQTFETAPDWLLKPEDLVLGEKIKEGRFALIYNAILYENGKPTKVVAKTLKENFTEDDAVLMAAKINFFGTKVGHHPNVLQLIGGITGDPAMGPVMILELCPNGTMKEWLTAHKSKVNEAAIDRLYKFSYDIVRGMEYLASRDVIHMRLAARNIFLSASMAAKVAGFGPRHGDDEEDGGKKERIPVKWIAPECFDNHKASSESSDVWSFGVVLWEIFTFGETPYPDIRSPDLPKFLKKGGRLDKPEYCDDTHGVIMKNCWMKEPKQRPTFMSMRITVENMFQEDNGELYYDTNR